MSDNSLPEGSLRASVSGSRPIDEPDNSARVHPLVRVEEGASSTSVTWVSLDGRHRELATHRSARLYYVLQGEISFVLRGGRPVRIGADELLVIPRGCPYWFEGSATYLVLNTPAFEEGDDEYSD